MRQTNPVLFVFLGLVLLGLGYTHAGQLSGTSNSNGNGAPVGACVDGSHYVDSLTGDTWTCSAGWKKRSAVIAKGTINISAVSMPSLGCTNYIVGWPAPGAAATDTVVSSFKLSPPDPDGFLIFNWFLQPNTLYLRLCNPTGVSQNVTTATVNWSVIR